MRKIATTASSGTRGPQPPGHRGRRLLALGLGSLLIGALAGCDGGGDPPPVAEDPALGKALIVSNGCASCHVIPGVSVPRPSFLERSSTQVGPLLKWPL